MVTSVTRKESMRYPCQKLSQCIGRKHRLRSILVVTGIGACVMPINGWAPCNFISEVANENGYRHAPIFSFRGTYLVFSLSMLVVTAINLPVIFSNFVPSLLPLPSLLASCRFQDKLQQNLMQLAALADSQTPPPNQPPQY